MSRHLRRAILDIRRVVDRWPMTLVVIAYLGSALVIPIGTVAAPADEWIYSRAIERLVVEGVLSVPDAAAMNLVFHTAWGALFAEIFGLSFLILRSASALLMLGSALALFRLCRTLGVSKRAAVLAASAYLFHPMAVVLGWSTMTDATFAALVVLATWAFVEGSRGGRIDLLWIMVGSLISCAAYLVRQQGILIPIAFVVWALTTKHLRTPRLFASLSALALGPPILTASVFSWWLQRVNGMPAARQGAIDLALGASALDWIALIGGVTIVAAGWCGLFVLPLAVGALGDRQNVTASLRQSWVGLHVVVVPLGVGMLYFATQGRLMPYAASWVTSRGLGPDDVLGGRHAFIADWHQVALTLVVFAALCVAISYVWRVRSQIGRLLLIILIAQLGGAIVASMPFRTVPSLDRYMLPLLPLVLALTAAAMPMNGRALRTGFLVVALFGLAGVVGTRDWLTFQNAIWRTADQAVASNAKITSIEGGAGWGGYHLYEYSRRNGLQNRDPEAPSWVRLWDLSTDRCMMVTTTPLPELEIVARRSFDQWLGRDGSVFLLQRCDVGESTRQSGG